MLESRRGVKSLEEVVCWDGDTVLAGPFCPGRAVEFPSLHPHLLNQGKTHRKPKMSSCQVLLSPLRGVSNTLCSSPRDPARDTLTGSCSLQSHLGEGGAGTPLLADVTRHPFTLEGGLMGLHLPEAADDPRRLDFARAVPLGFSVVGGAAAPGAGW